MQKVDCTENQTWPNYGSMQQYIQSLKSFGITLNYQKYPNEEA
jgi:hypothetical protein